MKIAMLGTRGVPAHYGGFETAVEEIGAGLAARGHDVVVYSRGEPGADHYRGMRRIVLPSLRRRALETLSHTGLSTWHALRHRPDVALVFNAANAPWVAALRAAGVPTALHVDGHDARRAKWRGFGKRYYSQATRWGATVASATVVDSAAIRQELLALHGQDSVFIPYGARPTTTSGPARALAEHGLTRGGYHLLVARFEPENHVLEALEGYAASSAVLPLAVVGFASYAGEYVLGVERAAAADTRIRLLGAVWDQDLLDGLYGGALTYVHGHSVGGTNPSLLRAMAQGAPALVFDCAYNLETTGGHSRSWRTPAQVRRLFEDAERDPPALREVADRARQRVADHYTWEGVVEQYDQLVRQLLSGS